MLQDDIAHVCGSSDNRARRLLLQADVESAQLMKECAASLNSPAAMQVPCRPVRWKSGVRRRGKSGGDGVARAGAGLRERKGEGGTWAIPGSLSPSTERGPLPECPGAGPEASR